MDRRETLGKLTRGAARRVGLRGGAVVDHLPVLDVRNIDRLPLLQCGRTPPYQLVV